MFKVGDKVRIINRWTSNNKVGDVGKIIEVSGSTYRIQVEGGPKHSNWSRDKDIELVVDDPTWAEMSCQEQLETMKAYHVSIKSVQFKAPGGEEWWNTTNCLTFLDNYHYRVKPEEPTKVNLHFYVKNGEVKVGAQHPGPNYKITFDAQGDIPVEHTIKMEKK